MTSSFVKSKHGLLVLTLMLFLGACKPNEFYEKTNLLGDIDRPITDDHGNVDFEDENEGENEDEENENDEQGLCDSGTNEDLICNPLIGDDKEEETDSEDIPAVSARKLGLIAYLYEGQNGWEHIDRYLVDGYKHNEAIYFSNFNVPTRAFDEGFGYRKDLYLKNQNGEKLIEWFALKASGNILLPENETSGAYHIVTLSDDGIRVVVDGTTILENPSIHAPMIDCAKELITLNSNEEKSFELSYFQGPRMHISLQTFIKKIDDVENFKRENFCSTSADDGTRLIQNGYKVISPAWFTLPAGY